MLCVLVGSCVVIYLGPNFVESPYLWGAVYVNARSCCSTVNR